MKLAWRSCRLTAWIAIFAILLAALAPGVARGLSAPQQATGWTEICTVAGLQVVRDTAPLPGSGQHEGTGIQHCPFCLSHAGHFALPTAGCAWQPATDTCTGYFALFAATPSPRPDRTAAQPRAPPAHS